MDGKKLKNPFLGKAGYDCFGCAPHNPVGIKLDFFEEGDEVVSYWTPGTHYQGFVNTLHGGIQALLLDEVSGWCVFRKLQTTSVTSQMNLKYLKPVSTVEGPLAIRASITGQRRNLVFLKAAIYNAVGELCTTAESTFYSFSKEKAREEFFFTGCDTEE